MRQETGHDPPLPPNLDVDGNFQLSLPEHHRGRSGNGDMVDCVVLGLEDRMTEWQ